jgi:hypothetical protein
MIIIRGNCKDILAKLSLVVRCENHINVSPELKLLFIEKKKTDLAGNLFCFKLAARVIANDI